MKTSKKSKSPIGSNNSKMSPIAETQEKTTLTDTPEQMRKNFLNCDIQTYEDSLTYAKKVIAMALSNIAYLRALWPESFFVTRYFENMELKVIESKSHPQARILTSWILGVFHALERKYLRRFTFSIHLDPKKPEEVIESYEFEISYNDKVNLEITEIRERAQKMRSNSVRFIRHLIYAAGMIKEFPEGKGFMNIRLFYYDEVTPVDYQPPGFKSSEWFDLSYKDGRVELPVGKLNSFWHVLNFSVNVSKTLVKDYDEYEKAGEVVSRNTNETNEIWMKVDLQRAKKLTTGIDQSISSTLEQSLVINSSSDLSGSMSSKDSKSNVVSSEQQIETNQESSDKNVDEKIECECGLNEHGNLRLLKCSVCETKQHAICYRILVPDNESGDEWLRNYKHYCRVCYQQLSLPKPSQVDLAIYRLDDSRVQKFCLLRRVVNYIVSVPEETSFTASSIGEKLGLDGDTVTELLSEMPKFTVNSKKKGAERSMKVSKGDVMAMANEWFTKPLERIRRQNESIKKRSLLESSFEVISNDETSFLTDVTDLKDKSDLSTTVDSTPSEKKVVKSKIKASPKRHRLSVSGFVKIDGNDDYY